ncbi:MAG: ankyrin repeat domain-containing protein [Armatimonadota bacterium]
MMRLTTRAATSIFAVLTTLMVPNALALAQTLPESAANSPAAKPPEAPPPGDPLGPDLYAAIRTGNIAGIKSLVAKGAQLEGRNWLGITPLIWAATSGNTASCAALIDAGAKVDTPSRYGTALSSAAMTGHTAIVRLLLAHGATANPERTDDISPLMTAAEVGNLETMRLLLTHKAAVNAQDFNGVTPLMFAARRGQTAAARLLLDSGAKINAQDNLGKTALMYASMNGHPGCTSLFIARHATVNARDKSKETALLLAARYAGNVSVARSLVRAGADRTATDSRGRNACRVAVDHENREFAAVALPPGKTLSGTSRPQTSLAEQARSAALRSLPRIETSARRFASQAACVSCHHEGLGLMTTGLAKKRGFPYDPALVATQIEKIVKGDEANAAALHGVLPHPEQYKHVPTVDMGEFTPGVAFLYSGLLAHGRAAGQPQSDAVQILAHQQFDDGWWGFYMQRAPIQSSDFATTAMAIRLMQSYMPKESRKEAEERISKARAWLVKAKALTNEDRTFRLLGLKWAGAGAKDIAGAARALRAMQRPDGGWAQLPTSVQGQNYVRSDAYATGQALYALNMAGGVAVTSDCYQRGVRFLLRTQDDDGTWFVNKRALPINTYLDAGFPHGESQYISYGGSCWATMALMLAAPPKSHQSPPTIARAGAKKVSAKNVKLSMVR